MHSMAMIATLLVVSTVRAETTFAKETPLLWTETDEKWSSDGSYELTLSLQLETPCSYLDEKDILWCKSEFDEKLFNKLQDLCMETVPAENQLRRKRWLSTIFKYIKGFGKTLLGVATSFISAGNHANEATLNEHSNRISGMENGIRYLDSQIFSLNNEVRVNKANIASLMAKEEELQKDIVKNAIEIENLDNEIKVLEVKLMENQKDLQNFKREMSEELKKLNDAMKDLNKAITDLDQWRKNMDENLSDKIKAIGSFVAYFLQLETQMNAFSRNWRKGLLSDELFDILMLSHNDTVVNEYSGAKPKSCRFSKVTKLAVFSFEKKSVDSEIVILEAKPFRLHSPIQDSEEVEILSYQGPTNILFLSKSQCTVPFDKTNGLIYMPSTEDCHIFENQHTFQKFWIKSCESDIALYGKDVQIQQMAEKLFIYCYGQDINIYGHSQPCPNYVFSIHSNEEFEISKFGTGKLLKDQNYVARNDLLTSKINHRIFPNLLQLNFEDIPITRECISNTVNHVAIWSSVFAVCVIVAIAVYLHRRHTKVQKDFDHFLSKFKLRDGKGIHTMVREEVSKQLSVDGSETLDPPSYASCEKNTKGEIDSASGSRGFDFRMKLPSFLGKFQRSTSKEAEDDAGVKARIQMVGVKVM